MTQVSPQSWGVMRTYNLFVGIQNNISLNPFSDYFEVYKSLIKLSLKILCHIFYTFNVDNLDAIPGIINLVFFFHVIWFMPLILWCIYIWGVYKFIFYTERTESKPKTKNSSWARFEHCHRRGETTQCKWNKTYICTGAAKSRLWFTRVVLTSYSRWRVTAHSVFW